MATIDEPARGPLRAEPLGEDVRRSVADLVHGYARIVRERRGHECVDLFAPAAIYEIRETNPVEGHDAYTVRNRLEGAQIIADYVGSASSSAVKVYPMIHNLIAESQDGVVSSNCLMAAAAIPAGNDVLGVYDDTFVQIGGVWLFASRIYTIHDAPWKRSAAP